MIILPNIARPKSRGFIQLKSSNPYDHPIIEPNYLREVSDLQILIEGTPILKTIYVQKSNENCHAIYRY